MITDQIRVIDPLQFAGECWPDLMFSREQEEIIYSVRDNVETYVAAGNDLGKDFVAAFIALWFFVSRQPCRVVLTSVQYEQLHDVLWGELRGFVTRSRWDLPIRVIDKRADQLCPDGTIYRKYTTEMVCQCVGKGESILGRHIPKFGNIPRTLVVFDEASGIDSAIYDSTITWSHRRLAIGNCWPCENFFYKGIEAGNEEMPCLV